MVQLREELEMEVKNFVVIKARGQYILARVGEAQAFNFKTIAERDDKGMMTFGNQLVVFSALKVLYGNVEDGELAVGESDAAFYDTEAEAWEGLAERFNHIADGLEESVKGWREKASKIKAEGALKKA
jgi:hypothetical protein